MASMASVQLLSCNPASMVVRVWFWCLLGLFLEAANCTISLAVGLITQPCATTGWVLANNTRLSPKTKASLHRDNYLSRHGKMPVALQWYWERLTPSATPHLLPVFLPLSCLQCACYGAEATEGISYIPVKSGLPENEVNSHRALAEASLNLSPACQSAWDVKIIICNIFALYLKKIVIVVDVACVVSFFQSPFAQPDHIHAGYAHTSVSGSTTEILYMGVNPGYIPTPHQGQTLPPCPTFCSKVGQAHGQKLQHYPSGR